MLIVLRISGEELDVAACRGYFPGASIEATWEKGTVRNGKLRETSGVNVLLCDDPDAGTCLKVAVKKLSQFGDQLRALGSSGVKAEFDIALDVGGAGPTSMRLGTDELREIAAVGAELAVSAYPCSDL